MTKTLSSGGARLSVVIADSVQTTPNQDGKTKAFTRIEVVGMLAALGLLIAVVLPALANTRARADRAACVNNLGRVGQAFNSWAASHGELYPMQVSYSEGTQSHPSGLQNNIWLQFAWVSNNLPTPKILVCPTDTLKKTASDWGVSSTGGFLHPNHQNKSVSYTLSHPRFDLGRGVLSTDGNILGGQIYGACSTGISPIYGIPLPASGARWSADLHGNTGNLLFNDGSVEQTDHAGLRHSLTNQASDNQSFHYMLP